MKERYNIDDAIMAQRTYCREKTYMSFVPGNGICRECKQNIYAAVEHEDDETTGISVWEAASKHITRCPHCGFDFYALKASRIKNEYSKKGENYGQY